MKASSTVSREKTQKEATVTKENIAKVIRYKFIRLTQSIN
jgi:hypothetical protein